MIALDPEPWQEFAECRGMDPNLFFPGPHGSFKEARRTCAACCVRASCLEYALKNDILFGFWGGTSEKQRRVLRRARKAAAA